MGYQIYKTTEKDFKLFKRTCLEWIAKFGLTEWSISFVYVDNPTDQEGEDAIWWQAATLANSENNICRFEFYKNWKGHKPTKILIQRSAVHEVSHLLLEKLYFMGTNRRYTDFDMNQEFERLARRFENAFYPEV